MKKTTKKGYFFHYSLEDIRAYCKLSAKDKLEWLEEANRFTHKFLTPEKRRIWEKFRKGQI